METKNRDNVLSTRVDDIVFEKVEKLAKEQKVNKAKILNQAIHLYLNGSVGEPVRQNYVQANPHEATNTMLKPTLTLPDPKPKHQEAFHLTGKATNVNMLQVMTANRRKIKGLAYDKSMEQYFHLIRLPKQKSPSRLVNG